MSSAAALLAHRLVELPPSFRPVMLVRRGARFVRAAPRRGIGGARPPSPRRCRLTAACLAAERSVTSPHHADGTTEALLERTCEQVPVHEASGNQTLINLNLRDCADSGERQAVGVATAA
jgi:hypothetical protein